MTAVAMRPGSSRLAALMAAPGFLVGLFVTDLCPGTGMTPMSGACGLLVLGGVVFVGLGVLALSGRLGRNALVGVRIAGAMTSDNAWNAAQRASAPFMIITGVVGFLLAGAFGVPWLVNGSQPVDPQLLSNCFAGFLFVMSALIVVVSRRAIRRLHTKTDPSVAPWNR